MTTEEPWDVAQYHRYSTPRERPGRDLIERLGPASPGAIVDLGCGDGHLTNALAQRYANQPVTGVDVSAEMLEYARRTAGAAQWIEANIATWVPSQPLGLIFSNAALHWLPDHSTLLPRLIDFLAPGGTLAIQMPLSWNQPSHRLRKTCLDDALPSASLRQPRIQKLQIQLESPNVQNAATYFQLLTASVENLDIWTTEYLHVLNGDDPVLEWMRSTGLRPILEVLDADEQMSFIGAYRAALRVAYPQHEGTTLFPFSRIFIVATKAR